MQVQPIQGRLRDGNLDLRLNVVLFGFLLPVNASNPLFSNSLSVIMGHRMIHKLCEIFPLFDATLLLCRCHSDQFVFLRLSFILYPLSQIFKLEFHVRYKVVCQKIWTKPLQRVLCNCFVNLSMN